MRPEATPLTSAEAHLLAIIEGSDDAIVSKDLASVVRSWNPAAERLFGYTADEMIGQSIRKLIPDGRQAEEDRILAQIVAGEKVSAFFTERMRKDGSIVRVSVAVSPIRNEHGTIIGASKIARDIGPYLDVQTEKDEAQSRFRLLADNIAQFAWIAEPDGDINWYNQQWFKYTGTTLDEMRGWGWTKVHHPDHVQRIVESFRAAIASGNEWEETFPLRSAAGEYRWFLTRAKPIRDEQGATLAWFGTNTDITEQREQEEQIRTLLLEVNHRSKNMLATIQALARRTAPDDAGFVERFERRVAALSANQDLLVRRSWGELDLKEVIDAQLAFLDDASRGRIEASGQPVTLRARAAEVVGMALHELTVNAIKYGALSSEHGNVSITWRVEGGRFRLAWHEAGGPPVVKATSEGFGTTIIKAIPERSLQARVAHYFGPEGVSWTLECDTASLLQD